MSNFPKRLYEEKTTEWLLKVLKGNQGAINYHKGIISEVEETIAIIEHNNYQIKNELQRRGVEVQDE